MDENLSWTEEASRELYAHRLFRFRQSTQRGPGGRRGDFVLLDSPPWVNVIALDEGEGRRDLVLVRQYRFGSASLSLEFPGGIVDAGEDPLDAAKRELREETGFEAGRWDFLGRCNPNAAFMTNTMDTWLARDLRSPGPLDLDDDEFIEVVRRPLASMLAAPPEDFLVNGTMLVHWARFLIFWKGQD